MLHFAKSNAFAHNSTSQLGRQFPLASLASVAGASFELSITGTGVIRTDSADSGGGQEQQGDTGQPEATAGPARVYDRLYWVLGRVVRLDSRREQK